MEGGKLTIAVSRFFACKERSNFPPEDQGRILFPTAWGKRQNEKCSKSDKGGV